MLAESPFLLVGDHAGRAIPLAMGELGLSRADRERHIAVDIGTEELGVTLSARLQAPFVRQSYSRLVIDCNRDPLRSDAVPSISDGTTVPGNLDVGDAALQARVAEIHEPYQQAIGRVLDARSEAGLQTILVSLHSFTPFLSGRARPWHFGVLHDGGRDDLALCLLDELRKPDRYVIGSNEPYAMDETDYTVPRHAFSRDLRYVELEVRQDLIQAATSEVLERIAKFLADALERCGTLCLRSEWVTR